MKSAKNKVVWELKSQKLEVSDDARKSRFPTNRKFLSKTEGIAIFLIQLILLMPLYSLDAFGISISKVDAISQNPNTAIVTWITDKESTSTVIYGENEKSLAGYTTDHSVDIDGLQNGQKYSYYVKSCNASLSCAASSNFTFIAGADSGTTLNVSLPRYLNRRVIDITGSTKASSTVFLYINDFSTPKRILLPSEMISGKFSFPQMQLEGENQIKVVAKDKAGNVAEKTFDVTVDTEEPAVKLSNISRISPRRNISISGTVSEPVAIKIYSDSQVNLSQNPAKPKLSTTKIDKNAVELKWDESKDNDFSHYVIYRNGVAIALARPASFTLFTDALVDSGKTYTYEVSAVNTFGSEGPKSDIVSARTLDGGSILNLDYPPVNIFEDFRKPIMEFNATGEFSKTLNLGKDGTYILKFSFEDNAGNELIIERTIIIDTKRPVIKISSPPQGAFVYENVAAEVDIIGTTEPNSKVHLYIDRHPFPNFNQSIELSGLPNEFLSALDELSEINLDAKCRLNLGGTQYCGNNADKSTVSDSNGNFRFEKVDLTAFLGQASRINEVPLTDFSQVSLNQDSKEAKKTTLLIIATDESGLRNFVKNTVRIGNCYNGNFSWDLVPLTEFQSPTFLSPERLAEGTEALYFYYNFSYIGRGTNEQITKVSIQKACSDKGLLDSRLNVSCSLFNGASSIAVNPPDKTVWYSTAQLARTQGMERFLENDWKSFLKAINNELTFPILVRISYKHSIIDEQGNLKEINEVQTTCDDVTYVMDDTLIDPRTVLPDWLLYDFVEYLQSSVKTLTKVQEQIDRLIDYVGQACLWTYLAHTVYKIYRTWVDLSNERLMFLTNIQRTDEWRAKCQPIIDAIEQKFGKPFRLKYMSDPDLRECFPSSYSAWNNEEKFYEWQRWSCDRIFGHSSPSRWTEAEEDEDLQSQREEQKKCETDSSIQGQPLRADRCISFGDRYPKAREFGIDAKCALVQMEGNRQGLYVIGNLVPGSNNLYELKLVTDLTSETRYAVRDSGNENYYLTARPKTCREICGVGLSQKKARVVPYSRVNSAQPSLIVQQDKKEYACITTSDCKAIAIDKKVMVDGKELVVDYTSARGYTSDCFYDPDEDSTNVVANSPELQEQCCCINTEGFAPEGYYQPDDVTIYDGNPAHESKSAVGPPTPKENDPRGFTDMDFSYRYSRIKFETLGKIYDLYDSYLYRNKYNPDRYIEGRDVYACFGQDSLLHSALGKKEEVLVLNPFKQHTAAMQCAYLTGVNQRLQMLTNIMTAMSNCLVEVRESGRGDSGVCKELFTQQVCGALWQAVRFFIDGCSPDDADVEAEKRDDGIAENLRLGFKGIAQGISESQTEISEEYGNAKLNNLLGIGEGGVARKACLAAFGYDWDLTAKNLVDAAYTAPFATLVQPVTRSREYLTVDPITLRPKYEYRASWFINPGCDIENYKVDLVCVGQKEINENPNDINCGAVGAPSVAYTGSLGTSTAYNQCDCQDLPEGKSTSFYGGTKRLKQNTPEEIDHHQVIDQNYRYDHLRFTLRTDRRIPPNIRQNCFPPGYEDGVFYRPIIDKTARDIADCSVNPLSGIYTCRGGASFVGQKGIVQVQQITLNGESTENTNSQQMQFSVGEDMTVETSLTMTGKDKCLRVSLQPDITNPRYEGIIGEGQIDIPVSFGKLSIASRTGDVIAPGVIQKLRNQNNDQPVNIQLNIVDNPTGYFGQTQNIVGVYSPDDSIVIEGMQIDMLTGPDEYSSGQTTINLEQGVGSLKNIVITKDNAVIEISGMQYLKDAQSNTYRLQTQIITINPPQQTTSTSQQKTVIVEVFNLKDANEVYSGPEDCNLNDRLYEKQIHFTVSQQGVDSSQLGPRIENPTYSVRAPIIIGNEVTISSRITHKESVREALISIQDLSGRSVAGADNARMVQQGDVFTYSFSTIGMNPGKYNVNIKATAGSGRSSTKTSQVELRQRSVQ